MRVIATSNINHNGEIYLKGSALEVSEMEAIQLIESGAASTDESNFVEPVVEPAITIEPTQPTIEAEPTQGELATDIPLEPTPSTEPSTISAELENESVIPTPQDIAATIEAEPSTSSIQLS